MPVARGSFAGGYRLGPRVPGPVKDLPTRIADLDLPSRVFRRSSSTCTSTDANLCEKPAAANSNVTTIVVAIIIPIAVLCIVLIYLHRRNVAKLRREDAMDPHKSLDFGLAMDPTQSAKNKRKSRLRGGAAEKETMGANGSATRPRQLSMDMNLSSPYLLPPELQSSRESLHSLARTLHQNEDPYRPVTQYTTSDIGSLRSFRRDTREGSSIYTGSASSMADDGSGVPRSGNSTGRLAPPQKSRHLSSNNSSQSKSPAPPPYPDEKNPSNPFNMPAMPAPTKESFILEPFSAVVEDMGDTKTGTAVTTSDVQVPAPTARIPRKGVAPAPPPSRMPEPAAAQAISHRSVSEAGTVEEPFIYDSPGTLSKDAASPSGDTGSSTFPMPPRGASLSGEFPARRSSAASGPLASAAATAAAVAPIVEDPNEHYDNAQEDERGRSTQRRPSSEYPQENSQAPTLPLPEFDTRRLSAGFRPLPPDELLDSEDPETRANRIRSFYKEYFDDRKPDMAEYNRNFPPQGVPAQYRGDQNGGGDQYYEDYDPAYAGSSPYIDTRSNAFVMPYAQPVSRRAMTPPPSGSRFPGPRPHGGPRNFHGSLGGPGPFRPGSSNSGPRPGSSMSNQYGRPSSNMSGRYGAGPRRPLPPPMDLTTLPTPSKLKDDTLALLTVTDFAPPPTFKDQAAGRSQSPLGERKPYQMTLPVSSPLVSSFDEIPALPSPHLLRKSSTFTSLDFAPPRRFKDNDTMSDAGSIRSNRSGISAMNQAAIRGGAGRVSRLPGDSVFTQAVQMEQLKPQWGMRP